MRFTFQSVANPNNRYAIYENGSDNPGHNYNLNCRISDRLSIYDTMGDGEVQHSPDVCPANDASTMIDFVDSLLPHLAGLSGEILDSVRRIFVSYTTPTAKQLDWLQKLKYDETKYEFVNFNDCKKSRTESKAYDKRWERLGSEFDKSLDAVWQGIHRIDGYKYLDPIQSVYLMVHVYRHCDSSIYDVARALTSTGSIYSGVDLDDLVSWVNKVQIIGEYLQKRHDCERYEESFGRMTNKLATA